MYCRLTFGRILLTRCPLSPWPDLGTVTLETDGFVEVLAWRRMVRGFRFQKLFAEDLAEQLLVATQSLAGPHVKVRITYRRLFGLVTVKVGDEW